MKRIISCILLVVTLLSFVGCAEKVPNVAVKDIMTDVEKETEKFNGLMEISLPKEEITDLDKPMLEGLGINAEDIEEAIIKFPMINLQVDEIMIIKVKDAEKIPQIEEGLKNHVENVVKSFENYVPQNHEIAQNYIMKTKGNYIFLAMSEDAEKAEVVFDRFLNIK